MLDPRSLEERRDEIAESCRRRGTSGDVDAAIAAYRQLATAQTELNECNRVRNEHQAGGKQKLSPEERDAHVAEGRRLKEEVAKLEAVVHERQALVDAQLLALPNFVHPEVPDGGEDEFNLLRSVGEPRRFDFEPSDHLAIADRHALVDFDAGAKVTGQKFYFFKNEAVLLELGLQRLALDIARRAGYTPFATPDLARRKIVDGLAFSPRGPETQIYSVDGTDLDLIGTAEITLGGLHADEVIADSELPIKLVGLSHCYRTEAGSAGRESKGLYRVHQFSKVEMFALTRPDESAAVHDELVDLEEQILAALELPYRVIDVAAGDLGAPAYRKFDIEAWLPGRGEGGAYGEVTSASNCTDFQARRLKIRFKPEGGKRNLFVHTLNGTAVAVPRIIIALLENHQNADGSVTVPEALRPYVGFERIG